MKQLGGKVLFLDRKDINTDEVIPARYLNEDSKKALGPYLFEDLELPGFDRARDLAGKGVILSRSNFGCGSSREHAPWALEANGINVVVAESFARIFRGNMNNCGMVALELPAETIAQLFGRFAGRETELELDLGAGKLRFSSTSGEELLLPLSLGEFELAMVQSGGWVEFAADRY
ncbi:MAG: 3-isopropylmalate dehydratase small subunit [Spirochaetes bacterium]|nr:3-isopropylmalate dehydratase small subunit [Spirochaetota bacterium]